MSENQPVISQVARLARSSVARGVAGPTLIVGGVLVLLHGHAFGGKIANGDLPTFWLPTFCYLGRSLASGHIPTWNPYVMGGVPFAADPQSGWMYAPAMLLFSLFPCDVAIRWMVVLQPIIAGLGIYSFLRTEGTRRSSATVGGLVLSMGIAASQLSNSLPLSGAIAWTAVALAACSRYFHAKYRPGRTVWVGVTGLAWGQLAASHFSIGMVLGTGFIAAYAVAKAWDPRVLAQVGSRRAVFALGALLLPVFALVNLAYLLPRLGYLPRTSLGLGYAALQELTTELSGFEVHRPVPASSPTWPLKLAITPGTHPGAIALGLMFVPILSRRFRAVAVAFMAYGALSYVLTLRSVAAWVERADVSSRVADAYLHSPEWWGYGLLVVLAVLAGLGIEAWQQAERSPRRLWAVGAAVLVWGALPPIFGASPFELAFLWAGAAAAVAVLALAGKHPAMALAIPIVVAAELLASGLVGYRRPPFGPIPRLLVDRAEPTISTAAYVGAGPVVHALQRLPGGRYLLQDVGGWERLQADPRSPLFHLQHVQGYNPVQLRRYWIFVRKLSGTPLAYNLSLFHHPPDVVRNLLHVRYIVSGAPTAPERSRLVDRHGRLSIFEVSRPADQASLVTGSRQVAGSDEALQAITDPAFDPSTTAILENDQGVSLPGPPEDQPGTSRVRYVQRGPQEAQVNVTAASPGVLVVRTPYDQNWRATVDGNPVPVVPANYLIQAVPVPAGTHVVRLTYEDRSVGIGLLGSLVSLTALAMFALLMRRGTHTR